MSGGPSQFTLTPSSLIDALYESLRKRIVNGELPPGEKVTEARVASEYNVARPTAKACLERLTAAGLLNRSAHRTAVVPALDAAEIEDLFFTREVIERTAVRRLARSRSVPPAARTAQYAIERAAEEQVFAQQVEADIAFHASLVAAVGSKRLSKMHELIVGEVQLTMGQFQAHRTADPGAVPAEHEAILAAIEAGEPDCAAERMSVHLTAARHRLVAQAEAGATRSGPVR
jgi:DNA-binding GntR family transcriptional regulator